MDDQSKVPLEDLVHRALEHLVGYPRVFGHKMRGQDVARQDHRLAVGRAHALDHQHVLSWLQVELSRLARGGGLEPVPALLSPGLHARGPDRFGHAEVHLEAVRDAGTLRHVSSRAPHPANEALALECPERLAQRGPGHAKLRRQRRFRGEARPGCEQASIDPFGDLVAHRHAAWTGTRLHGPGFIWHLVSKYLSDNFPRQAGLDLPPRLA